MKKFLIALSMLGLVGISAPAFTPAEAQGFSVRIGDGGGYGRHHNRGRHYGWNRGRHHGWHHRSHHGFYGHHRNRVVIQRGYGW